jgi:hypothetical protein
MQALETGWRYPPETTSRPDLRSGSVDETIYFLGMTAQDQLLGPPAGGSEIELKEATPAEQSWSAPPTTGSEHR